jgi:hypothetical protein
MAIVAWLMIVQSALAFTPAATISEANSCRLDVPLTCHGAIRASSPE